MPYYDDVPLDVVLLRHEERVKWYRDKATREEPVYKFFESLDTGLLPEEIKERLNEIRNEKRRIKSKLRLIKSKDFRNLEVELNRCIYNAKVVMSKRAKILVEKFYGKSHEPKDLENIKEEEKKFISKAMEIEMQMIKICHTIRVDPRPYLRVHEIASKNYSELLREARDDGRV